MATHTETETVLKTILKNEGLTTQNVVDSVPGPSTSKIISTPEVKEEIKPQQDVNIKPESLPLPTIAKKIEIAAPLARFPFILKKDKRISTYFPSSMNYYTVLHYMDDLMASNLYFTDKGYIWHPFISRLYFGVLYYYQVLRAMHHAKVLSSHDSVFVTNLIAQLPPERLSVPGPLIPILKSITCSEPTDPYYTYVVPSISSRPGPDSAQDLIGRETSILMSPNLPFICGVIHNMIHRRMEYIDEDSYTDREEFIINGHAFEIENWHPVERNVFIQPGMTYLPETSDELNAEFLANAGDLEIPNFAEDDNIEDIPSYTLLHDVEWIDRINETMSTYCSFFKDSGNLGQCSPYGPPTGLIRSRLHTITSATAETNIANTLTKWSPEMYPFQLIYDQRSYETNIPQPYQAMGQYACINTSTSYRGLGSWYNLNANNQGRIGPYWLQNPSNLRIAEDKGMSEIGRIVADYYYIEDPGSK